MQKPAKVERNEFKERIKLYLEENQKELRALHNRKAIPGRQLAKKRSQVIDRLIKRSLIHLGFSDLKAV